MQCHLNKFIHLRRYDEIALLVHESVNDDLSKPAQHRVWPPDMARAHWLESQDGWQPDDGGPVSTPAAEDLFAHHP